MPDRGSNPLFTSEPHVHTHRSRVGNGFHVHVEWETDEPDEQQAMHDTGPFDMRRQLLARNLAVDPEIRVAASDVSMAHPADTSEMGEQLRQARAAQRPQPESERGPESAARRSPLPPTTMTAAVLFSGLAFIALAVWGLSLLFDGSPRPSIVASPPSTLPPTTSAQEPSGEQRNPAAQLFDEDRPQVDFEALPSLENLPDEDTMRLVIPAPGEPAADSLLRPLVAVMRDDTVHLEGTAPSVEVGAKYVERAVAIWGSGNVVARYSVHPDAPEPLADDVELQKPVLFESGSAVIDPEFYAVLDLCTTFLEERPQVTMIVEGHTDSTGDDQTNLQLAAQRAQSIVDYYVSKGLSPERFTAQALGEAEPLSENDTDEGRRTNRRTDFSLVDALSEDPDANS